MRLARAAIQDEYYHKQPWRTRRVNERFMSMNPWGRSRGPVSAWIHVPKGGDTEWCGPCWLFYSLRQLVR